MEEIRTVGGKEEGKEREGRKEEKTVGRKKRGLSK
jgi:hypothetical protein